MVPPVCGAVFMLARTVVRHWNTPTVAQHIVGACCVGMHAAAHFAQMLLAFSISFAGGFSWHGSAMGIFKVHNAHRLTSIPLATGFVPQWVMHRRKTLSHCLEIGLCVVALIEMMCSGWLAALGVMFTPSMHQQVTAAEHGQAQLSALFEEVGAVKARDRLRFSMLVRLV